MLISKKSGRVETNTVIMLLGVLLVIFLLTRPAPFPASTYWQLSIARDFGDLVSDWVYFPEKIELAIVNSSASLFGLKVLYHILFFTICGMLCYWVFKGEEAWPGILVLISFAFALQSVVDLRLLLAMLFIVGLFIVFEQKILVNNFGFLLIPVTAAASALSLNGWLLILLVTCYVAFVDEYRPSLILCALVGLLFFPEGAAAAVDGSSVFAWHFFIPAIQKQMYLFAGILLIINVINFYRLTYEDLPAIAFYAVSGFYALLNPYNMPIFILVGTIVLLKCFDELETLSMSGSLVVVAVITLVINLFLLHNSFSININPTVKYEMGSLLEPVVSGDAKTVYIKNYSIGELVWKGIVNINEDDLKRLSRFRDWKLKKICNNEYVLTR